MAIDGVSRDHDGADCGLATSAETVCDCTTQPGPSIAIPGDGTTRGDVPRTVAPGEVVANGIQSPRARHRRSRSRAISGRELSLERVHLALQIGYLTLQRAHLIRQVVALN